LAFHSSYTKYLIAVNVWQWVKLTGSFSSSLTVINVKPRCRFTELVREVSCKKLHFTLLFSIENARHCWSFCEFLHSESLHFGSLLNDAFQKY